MKKIEDYLHLYFGCEGQYYAGYGRHGKQWVKAKLVGFTSQEKLILICYDKEGKEWGYDVVAGFDEFKPALRPLSDMTEDEAISIYTIERDRMLHPPTNEHDIRRADGCWKIVRLDHIDTTLFITDNAIVYKVTEEGGKPMIEFIRNLPDIFHYLLSKGFDLFNLIPEGLAIDKTTFGSV